MYKTVNQSMIHGKVAPGFEDASIEFERAFTQRGEMGAACSIYHKGEKVVDLWGGYRDVKTGAPWEQDTMVLVFSATKGLSSMAMAVAHSRGYFDYDEKVATYWPEFAQQGKESITIRQILSHQAGLCAIDEPLDLEKLVNLDVIAAAIAKQKPHWKPGTKHGYHAASLGLYEGELTEIPDSRLATVKLYPPPKMLFHPIAMPWRVTLSMLMPWSLTYRSFMNPNKGDCNAREYLSVEFPAGNGVGDARSMARAYSAFSTSGSELGITKKTMEALTTPAALPSLGPYDQVLKFDTRYSVGYSIPYDDPNSSKSKRAFGTDGMGGSYAYADPDTQIGFAYITNHHGYYPNDDPREKSIRDAIYRCIKKLG
jgi:CubicO group peptidase (beta-lactamase class C family)